MSKVVKWMNLSKAYCRLNDAINDLDVVDDILCNMSQAERLTRDYLEANKLITDCLRLANEALSKINNLEYYAFMEASDEESNDNR